MTLRKLSTLLLIGVLLAPVLACGGSDDQASIQNTAAVTMRDADELSRLCPEGAIAFIRLNSMARIDKEVAVLMRAAGAPAQAIEEETPSAGLGQMMGNPKLEGVDLDRPVGIALFMGPGGPAPVFLLPISSKDAFQKAIESSPNWEFMKDMVGLAYVGDWAAWAMDPSMVEGLALRDTPVAIAKESLTGDASLALDMAAVYEIVKPQLDSMSDEDMMPPGAMPPGMEGMMSGMVDGLKSFLADSKTLHMSATLSDGWVAMGMRYDAKPGTETAKFLDASTARKPTLLGKVGSGGFMAIQANFSGAKLWEMLGPLYEAIYSEMAPDMIPLMKASFESLDGVAMQMGLADGITADGVSHLIDPAAYADLMKDMVPKMQEIFSKMAPPGMDEMPMSVEEVEGWEHAGVAIQGFKLKMNFGEAGNMPAEAQQMVDTLLGPDGFESYYAIVDEYALQSMGPGGKARIEALIDRVKGDGEVGHSATFDRAIEGYPEKTNGLMYLNFADIAKLVGNLDIPGMDDRVRSLLESPPSDLWMSCYWVSEGSSMKFGMKMSLSDLIEYVRSLVD